MYKNLNDLSSWKFAKTLEQNIGLFHLHSRYVVQILVHSRFDLVSLPVALEATELVSEPVTQMAVELINIHLISVQQKILV